MTDNEFSLRHLVRDVLAESSEADPGAIAALVLARITKPNTRDALDQALRLFVRQVISETRIKSAPNPAPSPINRSVKVAAIRDHWQRRLRDRVHVGATSWKFLADCNYEDLCAAAAERSQLAERNASWARQYREWAALLTDHDAATMRDLPNVVLADALGRAA